MLALSVWIAAAQPTPAATGTEAPPRSVPAKTTIGPVPGADNRAPTADNPLRGDDGVLRDGRRLFVLMNCAGCHGGRAGGGMGPSLRDEVWLYGDDDAQIFDSIAQGRANGMPAWGTQLPEREIWKLVTYIRSLRTPQEPDAPRN
ncbi:MAG: c-type cytochrome [Sinimarinibacterium flocculans]|uniref:c-type cytochrome n=1 Tax=Sinimarinibacterium flocculans TaxID=985250 RepID=UPI003C501F43